MNINKNLDNLIKELKVLTEETAEQSVPKTAIRYLIQKYDRRKFRHGAVAAVTNKVNYTPTNEAMKLRSEHPGLYEVYFIYHGNKKAKLLTREEGIPYDQAYAFFQYHTDLENEVFTELGYYKLTEFQEQTLPTEEEYE